MVPQDLYSAADLLETQSADRMGWVIPHDPLSVTEQVEIENIYTRLQDVETSELIGELHGQFTKQLPHSLRTLVRAHAIMRRWLIVQLVAPNIGVRSRQMRMELFLRAIEVCRLRSNKPDASQHMGDINQPCIRSFVETVLTSAILSPQSRLFYRPWMNIGTSRGVSIESLSSLLSRRCVEGIRSRNDLTVDVGWVFERMLETISMSDALESSTGGPGLINFDKRRCVGCLVLYG